MTTGQKLSVLIGVLSALSGGTAQLTPVFGSIVSHSIVSVANLIMAIFVTPVLFVVTGQKNIVQTVQAMPGIESIQVNSQANKTLATLAVDQAEAKVDIIPGANAAVTATAKG
jgi:delta-aminolevulinic acid dehydratase/porphobilinogen synthase